MVVIACSLHSMGSQEHRRIVHPTIESRGTPQSTCPRAWLDRAADSGVPRRRPVPSRATVDAMRNTAPRVHQAVAREVAEAYLDATDRRDLLTVAAFAQLVKETDLLFWWITRPA